MPFTISKTKEQDLNLLQLRDNLTGIQVKILPECGALLHEFSIPLPEGRLNVVSSYKNLSDVRQNHPLFFRSAKLSPFPCRIYKGEYQFEGKTYKFKNKFKDGSAIHGILSGKPFTPVEESTDDQAASVLLEYRYNKEEEPGYPFDYKLTVRYTLKEEGLLCLESTVTNLCPVRIPIADGWHPYFSLGGKVNDWVLTIAAKEILAFGDNLIPTGERILFDHFFSGVPIGSFALDHCFLPDVRSGNRVCLLYNPANRTALSFFPDKTYPYLQIYTAEDRNSLAIENLSAAPDCFNNGLGLIVLEPQHSQTFTARYQLGLQ